jgi:hypothetical protein
MKGARRLPDDDLVETEKTLPKRMRPMDCPTMRELRRRRDMVWALLSRTGMDCVQISLACALANKSPRQIRARLSEFRKYHARHGRELPAR